MMTSAQDGAPAALDEQAFLIPSEVRIPSVKTDMKKAHRSELFSVAWRARKDGSRFAFALRALRRLSNGPF
ncbi:MAG: hypothetical protein DSZ00_02165 [Gammaproteobacteria bacterium]|nr:MAG: hypothetical protein DSZ00_02165 [Gammaproteobacteria bacterium]